MDKAEKNAARDLILPKEIADYTFEEWGWIEHYNEVHTKTTLRSLKPKRRRSTCRPLCFAADTAKPSSVWRRRVFPSTTITR